MRVHLVIVEATWSYKEGYIHYTEGSSARIETHLDNESHLIIKHPPPQGAMETDHHFTQEDKYSTYQQKSTKLQLPPSF